MKLLLFTTAALQLSAGAFASSFFIYAGKLNDIQAFSFVPSIPTKCLDGNDKEDYTLDCYLAKDDVSHGRKGVVCEGEGCAPWERGDPDLIERLEFSTEFGHFTYYKGPAQELVGLDGNVYGHCYALPLNTNPIHCRMLYDDIEEIVDYFDASAYFWCKLDNIEMTDNPPY